MNTLKIANPYLENINDWMKSKDYQTVETTLLFESDCNTKSFIAGVYNEEGYINIRILRMFSSKVKIKVKEDLIVSCDLDINYNVYKEYKSYKDVKADIQELMNIIAKAYKIGARVGIR